MKKVKLILMTIALLAVAQVGFGQGYAGTRVMLKQLELGQTGQVIIANGDGVAVWQTANFDKATGITFNTANGTFTLNMQSGNDFTTDMDGRYLLIQDTSDLYHKVQVDDLLDKKADKTEIYTQSQIDNMLGAKADVTYVDGELADKADAANVYTKSQSDGKYINQNKIGDANGVAPLGSDGRVPQENLPTGSTVYKGTWDASTNTPTLSDATGTAGWQYRVTVAGTQNLGSGNIQFDAGDDVIHNGTRWEKVPSSTLVNSVNGKQGTVVLKMDDIDDVDAPNPQDGDVMRYNGSTGNYETEAITLSDIGAIGNKFVPGVSWDSAFSTGTAMLMTASGGAPSSKTYNGIYIPHSVDVNYGTELAFRDNEMYFRSKEAGTVNAWVQIADRGWVISQNYATSSNLLSKLDDLIAQKSETISGNGTNSVTLSETPLAFITHVISVNGIRQSPSDYTISGKTVTFTFTIASTDKVGADYSYAK